MRLAYKFLAAGAISPFTGFRWPGVGEWVSARPDREPAWVFACRKGDLPYWLEQELWLVELEGPGREARHQISAPRARLASRVHGWNAELRRDDGGRLWPARYPACVFATSMSAIRAASCPAAN